jgi:hypothetical protein
MKYIMIVIKKIITVIAILDLRQNPKTEKYLTKDRK